MTFINEPTFEDWHSLLLSCVPSAELREETGQLQLFRNELCIVVAEPPGRWRARHRRGMHRLGFRPVSSPGLVVWRWTLSLEELRSAARAHPLMTAEGPRSRAHALLAWSFAREQLMREQLRRVLADVFGYEPAQLCVELAEDEDDWDEAEDDPLDACAG